MILSDDLYSKYVKNYGKELIDSALKDFNSAWHGMGTIPDQNQINWYFDLYFTGICHALEEDTNTYKYINKKSKEN